MAGLGKFFNSETYTGRANVAKATYASFALLFLYFRLKRSVQKPDADKQSPSAAMPSPTEPSCNCMQPSCQQQCPPCQPCPQPCPQPTPPPVGSNPKKGIEQDPLFKDKAPQRKTDDDDDEC